MSCTDCGKTLEHLINIWKVRGVWKKILCDDCIEKYPYMKEDGSMGAVPIWSRVSLFRLNKLKQNSQENVDNCNKSDKPDKRRDIVIWL